MILGLDVQVFEDRVRPELLHLIPILDLTMANGVIDAVPGPLAADRASSPTKKSNTTLRGEM
jgi:hypothetical protein